MADKITPVPDLDNEAWIDLLYREAMGDATANESKFIRAAYDVMTPAQEANLERQEAMLITDDNPDEVIGDTDEADTGNSR